MTIGIPVGPMTPEDFASHFFVDAGAKTKSTNWTRLRDAVRTRDGLGARLLAAVKKLPAKGEIPDALWRELHDAMAEITRAERELER